MLLRFEIGKLAFVTILLHKFSMICFIESVEIYYLSCFLILLFLISLLKTDASLMTNEILVDHQGILLRSRCSPCSLLSSWGLLAGFGGNCSCYWLVNSVGVCSFGYKVGLHCCVLDMVCTWCVQKCVSCVVCMHVLRLV